MRFETATALGIPALEPYAGPPFPSRLIDGGFDRRLRFRSYPDRSCATSPAPSFVDEGMLLYQCGECLVISEGIGSGH